MWIWLDSSNNVQWYTTKNIITTCELTNMALFPITRKLFIVRQCWIDAKLLVTCTSDKCTSFTMNIYYTYYHAFSYELWITEILFHTIFSHSCTFKCECAGARAHVYITRSFRHIHIHIRIYRVFCKGWYKAVSTGKRDDWLCKNKLKISLNETLLLKNRKGKMFLNTTDILWVRF